MISDVYWLVVMFGRGNPFQTDRGGGKYDKKERNRENLS